MTLETQTYDASVAGRMCQHPDKVAAVLADLQLSMSSDCPAVNSSVLGTVVVGAVQSFSSSLLACISENVNETDPYANYTVSISLHLIGYDEI